MGVAPIRPGRAGAGGDTGPGQGGGATGVAVTGKLPGDNGELVEDGGEELVRQGPFGFAVRQCPDRGGFGGEASDQRGGPPRAQRAAPDVEEVGAVVAGEVRLDRLAVGG